MTNASSRGRIPAMGLVEDEGMTGNELLSVLEVGHLEDDQVRISASLGDPAHDRLVSRILTGAARQAPDARAYAIEWRGDRVPRGVELEGRVIGWMQHGVVKDEAGEQIGFYERLRDSAGEDRKLQSVLVILTG